MDKLSTLGWVFLLLPTLATATSLQVNQSELQCDDRQGPIYCSLSAAIDASNPGDDIHLSPGVYAGVLELNHDLQIHAESAEHTIIDGQGFGPVLRVAKSAKVSLSHLSIINGVANVGAGIFNHGQLNLQQVVVRDNTANHRGGGIYNGGHGQVNLQIQHSRIENNVSLGDDGFNIRYGGGGIYNSAQLRIEDSLIQGNRAFENGGGLFTNTRLLDKQSQVTLKRVIIRQNEADYGGGINTHGGIEITDSRIVQNRAAQQARSAGGGIFAHHSAALDVINSTIAQNHANAYGGGIRYYGINEAFLQNVTVVDNSVDENGYGAGLFVLKQSSAFHIGHSIVADNHDSKSRLADCRGPLSSYGFNMINQVKLCDFQQQYGDIIGSEAQPVQAGLVAQLDAEGQLLAYKPSGQSQVIDAGDRAGCLSHSGEILKRDQLGAARILDGNLDGAAVCDIGAVEFAQ
ncbi:MAG: hypothetical protein OEZ01_17355 [Candidatus Heimdallarchaeota archaeon]|nr:hypothetical protein [Gammaproteobacteria bacterium]MDH5647782.1 hypothetical protein [Candidatus Heimdallarchaeota archaeon]MDH5728364.1 hypothetical protein [Gammaproteobacteria bacterium]